MNAPKKNPKDNDNQSGNSSARFEQQILDTSSIGVLITRIGDGAILYANKTIASLLGIADVNSIIGRPAPDLYWDPKDRQMLLERFHTEGSITGNEIRARRFDGHMVWVSISIQSFSFEGEQVLLSEITDITARKQTEEALRASEEQFRSIYDNATIGLYRTTPDGRILMINPTGLRLLGFDSFDEISQRNLEESGFEQEDARKQFREKLEHEGTISLESEWKRKDGSSIYVHEGAKVFRNENGEILYYDGSFEDITERKRAENALQESERLLQLVMDNIPQAVFWKDKELAFMGGNQAVAEDAGLDSPQYLVGKTDFDMPWKDRAELYHADDQQVLELGEAKLNYEEMQTSPTGKQTWLRTSKIPMRDINGKIFAVLGMYEDITERKQAEAEIARYVSIIENSTDFIGMGRPDSQAFYLNRGARQMLGIDLQSPAEDYSILTLQAPSVLEQITQEVMPTAIEKGAWVGESAMVHTDGHEIPVSMSVLCHRDANGNILYFSNIARDISERKHLEHEIQESFERRGYQVQVSTEISQEVAAASELNDLFDRVVTLTKERLGYYHTQLLRYDATQDAVILINGYGEIGAKMLAGGHKMPMGRGLIGTAAASGKIVMRPTLADDPDWQPNPLLPETKGEIAVPIKLGEQILGVLDVQSDQAGAITEDDRLLLEGLCGQIAIAMQSAELVKAIRENEARLAEALRTARLANWEYDVEKDIFTFNDQFYSIFHTTAEKAGGYQLSSARYAELFVHPDDMEVVGMEIGKALSSKERVYNTTLDHRIVYEDGGIGYITVKLTVERDENGKITRYYGANQDITERKQAETRLAEAFRTARLANWEYDVEKDLFTFNDQFYSIFHTTAEKAGGYQLSSARYAELFVHPDDMEVVGMEIGKALSSTERVYNTTLDHRIVYGDGGVGYITVKLTVERDENGKITRYYGANQDITERKLAEEALASERRLLRVLMSTMLDLVYVKDSEHRFLLASDTVVRSLGAETSDEVVGKTDFDFHPRELAEQYQSDEKSLMESGLPLIDHEESAMDHATGAFRWLSSTKAPLRDSQGNVIGLVGLNRDITERKQAEEALRVNEARLAEALRTARLANWEYDVEKDLFTFNDQFYSIFHTTVEKAGGYQLSSARYAELFVHPDDREVVGAEIGKALSSTERVYNAAIDHRILYEDGSVGYITVKLTVERDENGKITRNYGANQDITERKQAEEALRRSEQEMSERLEEISRLYRTMSHEGWSTYRETTDLPKGFMFDQNGIKPLEDASQPEKSFAHIPMKVLGGEVVGDLAIADDPQHPISLEDIDFLQQVSDQVALALEGARLSAQTQSALAQTEKLSEAGLLFTRASDLQKVVKIAVETLGISKINRAALETFNYNGNEVESMDVIANWWNGTGHETTAVGTHYSLEVLPLIQLFITANPIFIKDAFQDDRIDSVSLQIVKKLNIHAVAVLPLFLAENQIGVLLLESEEIHEFNQDEIRLFSAMGPQISTVLENRRQFERAQKQAERESTLNIISQKIQSATTVEAVLQIAARELGHALGAPMTIAQLSMKDKK